MPMTLLLFFVLEKSSERKLMRRLYHASMKLISSLLDLLFPPRDTERLVREARMEEISRLLDPRRIEREPFPITTLLPYRKSLVKALVREAKYHNSKVAQHLLGVVLADALDALMEEDALGNDAPRILIPIPLGPKRRQERGHNQVEVICREAVAKTLVPHTLENSLLTRTRDTAPQTSLTRGQRLTNLEHAFTTTKPIDPHATYIVVDDVTTTGTTLAEAAMALRESGAVHVELLALAH